MNRLVPALLAVFLAFGTLMVASPALAVDNGQIGIRPANEPDYFHINLAPAAAIDESAIISNHTAAAVTLLTYPVDGLTTAQGGFSFAAQADARKNVGGWTQLDASQVVVPAQSEIRLPFQVQVPANTPPGDYYGGIVIQAAPVAGKTVTVKGGTAVKLSIVQRQAVRIYLTVAGTRHNRLQTGALGWKRKGGQVDFALPIRNDGNTILHPSSSLRLASTLGVNRALHFNVPESLLPGGSITLHAQLKNASPVQIGTATATEHSEAGTEKVRAAFTYVPWGILLGTLATIALLGILGYRLTRFVRRARHAIALTQTHTANHRQPPLS